MRYSLVTDSYLKLKSEDCVSFVRHPTSTFNMEEVGSPKKPVVRVKKIPLAQMGKYPLSLMEQRLCSFDVYLRNEGLDVLPARPLVRRDISDSFKIWDNLTWNRIDAWNFTTLNEISNIGTETVAKVKVSVGDLNISLHMNSLGYEGNSLPYVTTTWITVLVDTKTSLPYRMAFESVSAAINPGTEWTREPSKPDLPPLVADFLMTKIQKRKPSQESRTWYDKFMWQAQNRALSAETPEVAGGSDASPHPVFQDLLTTARTKVENNVVLHPSLKEISLKTTHKVWHDTVTTKLKVQLNFDELSSPNPIIRAEVTTWSKSDASRVLNNKTVVNLEDVSVDELGGPLFLSYSLVSQKKMAWKAKVQSMLEAMGQKKKSKTIFNSLLKKFAEMSKAKFCT